MRILLLHPPLLPTNDAGSLLRIDDHDNSRVPIGLLWLAASLINKGHEVRLANHALTPLMQSLEEVESFTPELVGLTCMSHHRASVREWSQIYKRRRPRTKLILGGVHASHLYRQILQRWPWIDFVAVGEAEHSLPALVRHLETGSADKPVPGIARRDRDGRVQWPGPAKPVADLGTLPIPAEQYAYDVVSTARGCPFDCSFCSSASIWGRRVRERPVEHVIEELTLLRRRHKFSQVHFKDETFTLKPERVRHLCEAMIEARLNLWWTCDTRADCVNEPTLAWMRRAGCFYLSLGVESGSSATLNTLNKHIQPQQVIEATDLARRFGFMVRYYLIGGVPGERSEDLQATLELVRRARPHFVFISGLSLSPGTRVFQDYCQRSGTNEDLWFESDQPLILYDPRQRWKQMRPGRQLTAYANTGPNGGNAQPHHPLQEEELLEAQQRLPDAFATNYDLAFFYKTQGRFEEAIPYYQRALEANRDFGKGWLDLGVCLDGLGRLVEAVERWQRVERIEGESEENVLLAWIYRGLASVAEGDLEGALDLWQRAHKRRPHAVDPLRLIAQHAAAGGRWRELAWAAEQWARLDPASGEPIHMAAIAAMAQDQLGDAEVLFQRAVQLSPENPDIYNNYAVLLSRRGRLDEAARLLKTCLKINPQHHSARRLMGQLRPKTS